MQCHVARKKTWGQGGDSCLVDVSHFHIKIHTRTVCLSCLDYRGPCKPVILMGCGQTAGVWVAGGNGTFLYYDGNASGSWTDACEDTCAALRRVFMQVT